MWSIERRHFQWSWTTPTTSFKVTPFFDAEYLINKTTYIHSFNEILIGTYTRPAQQCHFEWSWVTWQNIQWHEASRGISAIAELLVFTASRGNNFVGGICAPPNALLVWQSEQRTIIQWLVHWLLMGGLLHLVQQGWAWAEWGPAQSPPRCTKRNSPPINQLHIIRCGSIITSAHWRVTSYHPHNDSVARWYVFISVSLCANRCVCVCKDKR